MAQIKDLKDAIYWPLEDEDQRPLLIKIIDNEIEKKER